MLLGMTMRPEFEQLYREYAHDAKSHELLKIEGIAPHQMDAGISSHRFFESKLADIATDSNSNAVEDISPANYRAFVENSQMKLLGYFTLWHYSEKRYGKEFADKAIRMIWDGDLYFHDAHGVKIQMPYCYAFSLSNLIYEGRPYGTSPNTPPKHRKAFLSQVDKLICDLSKQFAGAVAPSDFFLWYAYFCKKDGLRPYPLPWDASHDDVGEIINDLQGLVCLLNEPSRAEGEPPFTNIALYDRPGLEHLFGHIEYPDGTTPDLDYIMTLQEIFADWFSHGDPITGFPYRFPVVTMNLTTDDRNEFIDTDTARWISRINCRKANFNIHFGSRAKMAMCCRYENDLDDMGMSPDSFGNGGVNIGSHRVITPNVARAAKIANGDVQCMNWILDDMFDVACKLLIVHRYDILQGRIQRNPDYLRFFGRLGWFSLDTMFSTFGITGIHEACEFMGYDILDDDGTAFALDMLQYIKDMVKGYRRQYGIVFNIEEIPGEQACVALVQKDKIMIDSSIPYHFYSNQYIPLIMEADFITRVDLSGRFMSMVSGGGIMHYNAGVTVDSPGKMYEMLKFAAKSGVNHMAICYRFGMCSNGHTNVVGDSNTCPVCGEPIVRARNRVIGYYSDESNWHPVRREFDKRYFDGDTEIGGDEE